MLSRTPSTSNDTVDGSASGVHGWGAAAGSSGLSPNISAIRSLLPMPSIMQWCTLLITAQWPSASPSMSHVSHSGLLKSSR